jgi:hypothetical protein
VIVVEIVDGPWIDGHIPDQAIDASASVQLYARNAMAPVRWEILTDPGDLPDDFAISSTGLITFTADEAGSFSVVIRVTDSEPCQAEITLTWRVIVPPLQVTGTLDNMTVASAYSDTLTVQYGVPPYSFYPIESLPAGIAKTLAGGNASPVTISGTPTGVGLGPGTAIPFVVSFIVQDSIGGQAIFEQTVTVNVPAVSVTIDGGALPDATVGVAYSHDIDATGGVGSPYAFTKIAGPSWLTVDSSTGALGGTPSSGDVGTGVTVTVRATDSEGNWDEVTDTIDVSSALTYAYTTWNPDDKGSGLTLSNGNLTCARDTTSGAHSMVRAKIGKNSGKHYHELRFDTAASAGDWAAGYISNADPLGTYPGSGGANANSFGVFPDWPSNARTYKAGFATDRTGYGRLSSTGTYVYHAIDHDAGKGWLALSSASGWIGGGDPAAGTSPTYTFTPGTALNPALDLYNDPCTVTANFGASAFNGTVPAGFRAGVYAPASPGALSYSSRFSVASTNDIQGVATDGTHVWVSSSSTIYKYTMAGSLVTSRNVSGDNPTAKSQINGLTLDGGTLYVGCAQNSTPRNSWVAEYDPTALTYITHHAITGDWFLEGIAKRGGYWWAVFHADKTLAKIDPATWAVDATIPLTFNITGSSGGYGGTQGYDGIAFRGNYLFCNVHEIYDQDALDVYYLDTAAGTVEEVERKARPTIYGSQGVAYDAASGTFLFAERSPGGDSVATVTIS